MASWSMIALLVLGLVAADAFRPSLLPRYRQVRSQSFMSLEVSSETALSTARAFAASGFGLRDSSILAEDFVCSSSRSAYDKSRYLRGLALETSAFARAVPDLDFRPHGFVVDETDPSLVWFKVRPTGTVSGPFSYRGEVYLPNYETVDFPVQQISVQVAEEKVRRVSAGYVVDRLSGNTGEVRPLRQHAVNECSRRPRRIKGTPQRPGLTSESTGPVPSARHPATTRRQKPKGESSRQMDALSSLQVRTTSDD